MISLMIDSTESNRRSTLESNNSSLNIALINNSSASNRMYPCHLTDTKLRVTRTTGNTTMSSSTLRDIITTAKDNNRWTSRRTIRTKVNLRSTRRKTTIKISSLIGHNRVSINSRCKTTLGMTLIRAQTTWGRNSSTKVSLLSSRRTQLSFTLKDTTTTRVKFSRRK